MRMVTESEIKVDEEKMLDIQGINNSYQLKPNGWGKRHTQALLGFFACTMGLFLKIDMSLAIVAMTDKNNNTSNAQVYDWSKKTQDLILSSFFWGNTIIQIPGGMLALRFGGKFTLLLSCIISSVVSFLLPSLTNWGGMYLTCACRAVLGMSMGLIYPSLHMILGQWAPLSERGTLTVYTYVGAQFGKMLSMAMSGLLASTKIGWPLIFYSTGILTALVAGLCAWLGSDSPRKHSSITREEYAYIVNNRGSKKVQKYRKTPWKLMLTSVPLWATLITQGGNYWAFSTILLEVPSYLARVLKIDLKAVGFLTALPYLAMFLTSFILTHIFDFVIKHKWMTLITARKISNSIGTYLTGAALVAFAFVPATEVTTAICLLILTIGSHAGVNLGFLVNLIDLSPNFAGSAMAVGNTLANISSTLAPLAAGYIITDDTDLIQWRYVFCLSAGVLFVVNTIFIVFSTSETQNWNEWDNEVDEKGEETESKMLKKDQDV